MWNLSEKGYKIYFFHWNWFQILTIVAWNIFARIIIFHLNLNKLNKIKIARNIFFSRRIHNEIYIIKKNVLYFIKKIIDFIVRIYFFWQNNNWNSIIFLIIKLFQNIVLFSFLLQFFTPVAIKFEFIAPDSDLREREIVMLECY